MWEFFTDIRITDVLIAAFTGLLFAANIYLYRATRASADAATASVNTAKDAFTKLERPHVFIFGVDRLEIDRSLSFGDNPIVHYTVANYGKTPAQIVELRAGISTFPDGPLDPLTTDYRDDPAHGLLKLPILAPNERREDLRLSSPAGIEYAVPTEEVVPQLKDHENLWVWIIVKYRGPFSGG